MPVINASLSDALITTTPEHDLTLFSLLEANGWRPKRLGCGRFHVSLTQW